jgi:hypothetical protein
MLKCFIPTEFLLRQIIFNSVFVLEFTENPDTIGCIRPVVS